MQLREPEPVGVLDDHHGRVRHVDADLDDGRRDEHVELAGAELGHHRFLLLRRQLAVQQPEPQARELLVPAAARTPAVAALRLDLALVLDQRAHDVRLVAGLDLVAQPLPRRVLVERVRRRRPSS